MGWATELPRLPVPPLEQSVRVYLDSIVPFLLQTHGPQFEQEYRKREDWAKRLCQPNGLGQVLQNRLIDVDRRSPHNWLDDNYWIKVAYHSWREALPIHSNWWILLKADQDIPQEIVESIPQPGRFTDWQLRRAARVVHRVMLYKQMLDRKELLPDSSRAGRFCMHQYGCLFGTTRIPSRPSDHLNIPQKDARHVVVMAKGHIYSMEVLSKDSNLLSAQDIEVNLWGIANNIIRQPPAIPIGCLTGLNRDKWTKSREHLLSLSPSINRNSLSAVEDAIFAICLDDSTRSGGTKGHIVTASANHDGFNRWFDKSISFIFENNSRGSVSGEHSPCDALIPAIVTDFAIAQGVGPGLCDPAIRAASHDLELPRWKKLDWITDSKVLSDIEEAKTLVMAASMDSDGHLEWFEDYGTDYIKRAAKLSPDAFIQMAMQLAWYRQMGAVPSTYETALTRLFKHGRTDVIRTASKEGYEWVKAMDQKDEDWKGVYDLFIRAILVHNRYTKEASFGRAVDRHFLGLRLQHRPEEDGPLPDLFTDEVFAESSQWELSTSGLSTGDRFLGTGFGCFGKGYGINYLVGPDVIKFGIETKVSDPRTSASEFGRLIAQALRDMKVLCDRASVTWTGEDAKARL